MVLTLLSKGEGDDFKNKEKPQTISTCSWNQEGPDSSPEVTLGANISELQERIKFQAKEIDRMSNIHDLLIEKEK